jgi:hypothetical protein
METSDRFLPSASIHKVIPVGDDIVYRAAGVTKRDATVHAARSLFLLLLFRKPAVNFKPIIDPFRDWTPLRQLA